MVWKQGYQVGLPNFNADNVLLKTLTCLVNGNS